MLNPDKVIVPLVQKPVNYIIGIYQLTGFFLIYNIDLSWLNSAIKNHGRVNFRFLTIPDVQSKSSKNSGIFCLLLVCQQAFTCSKTTMKTPEQCVKDNNKETTTTSLTFVNYC